MSEDSNVGYRGTYSRKARIVGFYSEDNAVSGRNGYEILELMREKLSDISGYIVSVEAEKGGPPIGKALQINVLGKNGS